MSRQANSRDPLREFPQTGHTDNMDPLSAFFTLLFVIAIRMVFPPESGSVNRMRLIALTALLLAFCAACTPTLHGSAAGRPASDTLDESSARLRAMQLSEVSYELDMQLDAGSPEYRVVRSSFVSGSTRAEHRSPSTSAAAPWKPCPSTADLSRPPITTVFS